tara:strand:- start:1796 stop:3202 length:1407 start_codon:yes stop_codon:yes gene_type:complete
MNKEGFDEIIFKDNNQNILSQIVDSINFSQTNELRINHVLRGDLDFSVLKDKDIKNVNSIYIEKPGEITNLFNIPDSIKIIHCKEHVLQDISSLPKELEELDLSHNNIKKLDLSDISNLKHLNLADNELQELSNLPESLEYLNVENNQLKQLNLETTQNLKHLVCSNNPILVLQKVPDSVKIEMENNPFIEIDNDDTKTSKSGKKKLNYLQSLNEYLRLKNEYETAYMTAKRKAYYKGGSKKEKRRLVNEVKPLCVNCKRKVGTQFSYKDKYYIAKCGDEQNSCKLDISIYEGDHTNIEEVINMFSYDIEEDKEQIIIDKMNSIFKYVDAMSYSNEFKQHINDYNDTSDIYKETIDRYDSIYNNKEKELAIERKFDKIANIKEDIHKLLEEYKKTGNNKILKTMIETHKRDLVPAIEELRSLKYAHMYVEVIDSDPPVSKLVQYMVPIHSRDFIFGEDSNVLKFEINH